MYQDIKTLVETGSTPQETTGMILQYLDSAMGIPDWLDEDQSPEWAALPKEERERLYESMLKILKRKF